MEDLISTNADLVIIVFFGSMVFFFFMNVAYYLTSAFYK